LFFPGFLQEHDHGPDVVARLLVVLAVGAVAQRELLRSPTATEASLLGQVGNDEGVGSLRVALVDVRVDSTDAAMLRISYTYIKKPYSSSNDRDWFFFFSFSS
jgi:hypothetical protein